jgi:YVTN family beta-propeller protein
MRSFRIAALAALLFAPAAFAGSSNSLMDVSPDGSRLLVANTDSGTVTVVDLSLRRAVCELPAGDHPEGASWVGNGPLALATVYGDDCVVFYDTDQKKVAHVLPVGDEPYGIVVTKDGKTAYVSHDYPGSVSEIDVVARKVTRTFKVGENCRGIAISNDEKTLFVSEFLSAKLVAVDIASGKVTDSWPGYETDNLCRSVTLHPTRPKAYLSHLRSRVTHAGARGAIFPMLSMCDLWQKPADEKRRRAIALDTYNGVYVMANPWEAAVSPDGKKLYTIYAGTNDMNVSRTLDDDFKEIERVGTAIRVGTHPRAIRVRPDGSEVYVYNTLDYEVGVYDSNMRKLGKVSVCKPPHTPEWRRGKELFVSATQPMGGAKWISCSSCHPDGFSDGRVWQNPEGPRRTTSMFGLAHTHPLHWSADRDEVQDFEYTIRGPLMKGRGLYDGKIKPRPTFLPASELDEELSGKSKDLDALAIYTNSFPVRLSPNNPAPGKLSDEAERGKALFSANETKCATCHSGPYYTDSSLMRPFNVHDVGTGGDPVEKMGPKFDTPTLLGIYRSGPYLHDGRAKTLRDVLTTCNSGDKHGKTSHLKPAEVDDLVAFMKALPYETPPEETPNTVKYRVPLTYPRPVPGGMAAAEKVKR